MTLIKPPPRARSARAWADLKPMMQLIALEGNWLVGDWLHDATNLGLEDARVEELNGDARWEGTWCGELIFVAQRFRPSARRHKLPWLYYAAVAQLPDDAAHRLLAAAALDDHSLSEIKRAASKIKQDAKADA